MGNKPTQHSLRGQACTKPSSIHRKTSATHRITLFKGLPHREADQKSELYPACHSAPEAAVRDASLTSFDKGTELGSFCPFNPKPKSSPSESTFQSAAQDCDSRVCKPRGNQAFPRLGPNLGIPRILVDTVQ